MKTLHWSIKWSFIRYLSRMPGSTIEAANGAMQHANGEFQFPCTDDSKFDAVNRRGQLAFGGSVHFQGHGGRLSLKLEDPMLYFTGNGGSVTISSGGSRVQLANFVLQPEGLQTERVTLASEAVGLFNGAYPAGEPLDSLSLQPSSHQ